MSKPNQNRNWREIDQRPLFVLINSPGLMGVTTLAVQYSVDVAPSMAKPLETRLASMASIPTSSNPGSFNSQGWMGMISTYFNNQDDQFSSGPWRLFIEVNPHGPGWGLLKDVWWSGDPFGGNNKNDAIAARISGGADDAHAAAALAHATHAHAEFHGQFAKFVPDSKVRPVRSGAQVNAALVPKKQKKRTPQRADGESLCECPWLFRSFNSPRCETLDGSTWRLEHFFLDSSWLLNPLSTSVSILEQSWGHHPDQSLRKHHSWFQSCGKTVNIYEQLKTYRPYRCVCKWGIPQIGKSVRK